MVMSVSVKKARMPSYKCSVLIAMIPETKCPTNIKRPSSWLVYSLRQKILTRAACFFRKVRRKKML